MLVELPSSSPTDKVSDTLTSRRITSEMNVNFEFKLTYRLQRGSNIDQVTTRLAEEGCTDAMVGLGIDGQVALEFVREASSAEEALQSALRDVKRALPDAERI